MDLAPVLRSLRRWPAQIAGGPVDLSNLVLGLLAGKGTAGLSEEPIGGSAHLNRLTDNQTPGNPLLESALGFVDPAMLTKGLLAAATIPAALAVTKASAGAKGAKALSKQTGHMGPMTGDIADMLKPLLGSVQKASSPAEAAATTVKTAGRLQAAGNPYDIIAVVPTPGALNIMTRNRLSPFADGLNELWNAKLLRSGEYGTAEEFFRGTPAAPLYKDFTPSITIRGERMAPHDGGYYRPHSSQATINSYLPESYGSFPSQVAGHEISHALNETIIPSNVSSAGATTDPLWLAKYLADLAASPDPWTQKHALQLDHMKQYMDKVAKQVSAGRSLGPGATGNVHKIYENNWGEIMARHSQRPIVTDVAPGADDASSLAWILRHLHRSSLTPAAGAGPW